MTHKLWEMKVPKAIRAGSHFERRYQMNWTCAACGRGDGPEGDKAAPEDQIHVRLCDECYEEAQVEEIQAEERCALFN